MRKINWQNFIANYLENDSHWYVSKIKEYTEKEFKNLAAGLILLDLCFIDEISTERKALESFVFHPQKPLPRIEPPRALSKQWNNQTQLFYTSKLDYEKLISELNRAKHDKRKLYNQIRGDIENHLNYFAISKKYNPNDLNDYSANGRNFVSFFKKLGFAWVEKNRGVTISDAGYKFMEGDNIPHLLETQRIKWQLWNPSLPSRYANMRILPYFFLLKLLIKLIDVGLKSYLTKNEYALFVTKANKMDDIDQVLRQIRSFRSLKSKEQARIIKSLRSKKRKVDGIIKRSLLEEILDSAGKEIGFFTYKSLCESRRIGKADGIVLIDEKRAIALINKMEKEIQYVTFNNEEEWFHYYGDTKVKPILKDVIKYYKESGKYELVQKTVQEMKGRKVEITEEIEEERERAILEKEIEDFYEKNISIIRPDISLVKNGRQYPTEIGNIDLLTRDKNGRYVVIELKRDQADDDTIGQVLRYMGWVHINLAEEDFVSGMVISEDITDKIKYARKGMQHPDINELLQLIEHPEPVIKIIESIRRKISAKEFDYSI